MIRPQDLDFGPLHVSTGMPLGDYYQDFSAAVTLVELAYHGGLDADGVALTSIAGQGEFYNAITIAQYALASMALQDATDEHRERARAQLDWLVAGQEKEGRWAGCWLMGHNNPKYGWLRAPWTSSLASGNAISALLRGWELFGADRYRTCAETAYEALHAPRSEPLYEERDGTLWYEEYPAQPPLHVLNGHVYTLFGVLDYARVTGDQRATERWRKAAATTLASLSAFDLGYWSAYDSREREPANVHYHKNIHIPQLRILAGLTGDPGFTTVADRWERYLNSRISHVRLAVWLRLRRFMKR